MAGQKKVYDPDHVEKRKVIACAGLLDRSAQSIGGWEDETVTRLP